MSPGIACAQKVKASLGSHIYIPEEQKVFGETKKKPKRVIILAGPTAAGKTKLSLMVAKALGGEIISADSMQVYEGMDIGTAKASLEERTAIPHHLIGVRKITEEFNVVDFYYEARLACESIHARGRVPIVVGGAGFYLHTFLYGPPPGPPSVPEVRRVIEEDMVRFGPEALFDKLQGLDPVYCETITKHDKHKIVRALEIITLTGEKVSKVSWKNRVLPPDYDFHCWFVFRSRESLYRRIEKRCDVMLSEGFVKEVMELERQGIRQNHTATQAIGYRQCLTYLQTAQGEEDYKNFVRTFKAGSRQYAKRQFTWFRREPLFRWLNIELHDIEIASEIVLQDYLRS